MVHIVKPTLNRCYAEYNIVIDLKREGCNIMKIIIEKNAVNWFKDEFGAAEGDFIRFFVRYGGSGPMFEGYSLGMKEEDPIDMGIQQIIDGIIFFIEKDDLWFFQNYNLIVDADLDTNEIDFSYQINKDI